MPDQIEPESPLASEILHYYQNNDEAKRLFSGLGQLEFVRTQSIIERFIPTPPAVICDVGGGSGVYSCWLAQKGYEVHLFDGAPNLVEQARQASLKQPDFPLAGCAVGDARKLDRPENSVDVVLLFGPLYHLTEREDRLTALREAHRILRPGGILFAAGISRYASALDGLVRHLDDPLFDQVVWQDLTNGQHRNPTVKADYFTTAFFHHPDELKTEIIDAGLQYDRTLPVEGPVWLMQDFADRWTDPRLRERLLKIIRQLEHEPAFTTISSHMLAIGRKMV